MYALLYFVDTCQMTQRQGGRSSWHVSPNNVAVNDTRYRQEYPMEYHFVDGDWLIHTVWGTYNSFLGTAPSVSPQLALFTWLWMATVCWVAPAYCAFPPPFVYLYSEYNSYSFWVHIIVYLHTINSIHSNSSMCCSVYCSSQSERGCWGRIHRSRIDPIKGEHGNQDQIG